MPEPTIACLPGILEAANDLIAPLLLGPSPGTGYGMQFAAILKSTLVDTMALSLLR